MISDTQKMLDALSDDYEQWMNQRLDNEDELLRQIQDKLGDNGEIAKTLKEMSNKYGISMTQSFTDALTSANPFDGVTTAINKLIEKIGGMISSNSTNSSSSGSTNKTTQPQTTATTTSTTQSTTVPKTSTTTSSSQKNYDNIFIHKVYSKKDLNPETSVVDRLKNNDIQADFQSRVMYWSKIFGGTYTGSSSQNIQFLKWLKQNDYASGTLSAKGGLKWTQELGDELIIRKSDGAVLTPLNTGDTVFNADMTKRLWELAQQPIMSNLNIAKLPALQNRNTSQDISLGGINIAQVVANNPTEFVAQLKTAMANDRTVHKMVQEITLGQSMGRNSMNVKKYM